MVAVWGKSSETHMPDWPSVITPSGCGGNTLGPPIFGFSKPLTLDEARTQLPALAEEQRLEIVPPFHPDLVSGVATYAHELFINCTALDTVFVPIGLGSNSLRCPMPRSSCRRPAALSACTPH
jgi:hypothetical protein